MFCAGKRLSIGDDLQVVCLDHVEMRKQDSLLFFVVFLLVLRFEC